MLVLGVSMVLYHLAYTRTLFQGPVEHQNTHLMFALLLVFLGSLKKNPKFWSLAVLLILLSLVATGYIQVFYDDLEGRLVRNTTDVAIGILLLAVCFEATRQAFGVALPIVGLIFVGYTLLGQYLPRPLWHFPISIDMAIGSYNIGLTGMYGMPLGMSANYVFLFIIFGAFLRVSGAMQFFLQVSTLVGKRFAGGAGMTAVVSSCLVGTLTGQGSTNVAITGPFTIPLMKRVGYTGEQAAAIETVASTGGNIMPPVMGIAAFLMAEYIAVPYIQICAMAIMPALLYYLCLALFVQLNAGKMKVAHLSGEVDYWAMVKTAPLFVVPLAVLVWLLVVGYSLMFVSFVIPIVVFLLSLIRKETRGSVRTWVQACAEGAMTGASIAVSTSVIGIIIASINLTGIDILFPAMVGALSHGILLVALLLIALVTIILGCGIPPFASYMTVAMLCAPVLTKLGVPVIQTHFFLFFFAVSALITPPVAMTAMVAAPIAAASYIKTSIESVKAGVIAWLLPFLVIWIPGLVLQPQEPVEMATKLIASVITVLLLQVSITGYYFTELNVSEKSISWLSGLALVAFIAIGNYILLAIGLMLGILLTLWQYRKRKLIRAAAETHS
jgi:TRAP transporter 4TM/12TM fusion protein